MFDIDNNVIELRSNHFIDIGLVNYMLRFKIDESCGAYNVQKAFIPIQMLFDTHV